MNRLLEIGFQCVGHWILCDDRLVCDLTSLMESSNILYAFVSNGEIQYIGKTTQTLKARMKGYQNPGAKQSTNIKNNQNIKMLLEAGEAVDIFALPDNGLLHYGGFHINLAAGLEDSLITTLSPPWNGGRKAQLPDIQRSVSEVWNKNDSLRDTTDNDSIFQFQVRKTYYDQGFFNVSVKYEKSFGSDKDKIEIYFGDNPFPIQGYINRSVNPNSTPRVMGGVMLRDWFQSNLEIDGCVNVEVISPTSIRLRCTNS